MRSPIFPFLQGLKPLFYFAVYSAAEAAPDKTLVQQRRFKIPRCQAKGLGPPTPRLGRAGATFKPSGSRCILECGVAFVFKLERELRAAGAHDAPLDQHVNAVGDDVIEQPL